MYSPLIPVPELVLAIRVLFLMFMLMSQELQIFHFRFIKTSFAFSFLGHVSEYQTFFILESQQFSQIPPVKNTCS